MNSTPTATPPQSPLPRPFLADVRSYLEMIRFSHTLFALPFALASAALVWRTEPFRWLDLLGILICMVCARTAAMAFNRLADRTLDAANPRTATRHLPAGKLSVGAVWVFTLVAAVAFVAATLLFVPSNNNWVPFWLAVPVLLFLCGYSLTKRFTALCHVWLGTALMLAPVAVWIAVKGTVELPPVVLGLAVLCWVTGFDILYACQDVEFDQKSGLHSIPARVGVPAALKIAMVCHALMLVWLLLLWYLVPLGGVWLGGVLVVAVLLAYEHWLVRPEDLSRVNLAFFYVNIIISLGLFGLMLLDGWVKT
jgi:4-hydroxybenzoate polyprenyltransferase